MAKKQRNQYEELKRVEEELAQARRRFYKYNKKQEEILSTPSPNPEKDIKRRRKAFYVSTDLERAKRTVRSLEKQKRKLEKEIKRIIEGEDKDRLKVAIATREANRALREQGEELDALTSRRVFGFREHGSSAFQVELFISHAWEDKVEIVRPLADSIIEKGVSTWYDEYSLEIGDSLRQSIDQGLADAKFGLVILSPSFFRKNWTQYELNGLLAKEIGSEKVILPIWHRITKDEIIKSSPSLADKVALSSSILSIEEIAEKVFRAVVRER